VRLDPCYLRPSEVDVLLGDAAKARGELNWKPRVTFAGLVSMMVKSDLGIAQNELLLNQQGSGVL
jgi:GDPmannose 4,6-dehydratase